MLSNQTDMERQIQVPEELYLWMYQHLVLYGMLHGIGENDSFNKEISNIENLYEEQTGDKI